METLHLVGHNHKWNIDSHFQNKIGSGFIFCAYSFEYDFFKKSELNGHKMSNILKVSFLDLQYFGKKESGSIGKGKLSTYPFHPAAKIEDGTQTNIYIEGLIKEGIKYQIDLGLTNVIIPCHYENDKLEHFIGILKNINRWLSKNKIEGINYYMSIPIANHTIIEHEKVEKLLYCLTDLDIVFDGYYVICESKPEFKQKVSIDFKYLNNLSRIFKVLKKQKFLTIYAYANWDALLFLSQTDIDFITIATYENLRNFSIKRFLISEDGGPSKGWYFSEKVLNFIKAQLIDLIRQNNGIDIIRNDKNIFSEAILQANFPWNNHKPEVHKNYLLSINKELNDLNNVKNLLDRKKYMISLIDNAINNYNKLEQKNIYLTTEESKNYHLDIWKAFLLSI